MDDKDRQDLHQTVLGAIEASLEAQLRAVRRLRTSASEPATKPKKQGKSQVELVADILTSAGQELHISDIIERVRKRYAVQLDRESIVSALTKKVQRGDRFTRPNPNVFGLVRGNR